MKTDKITLKLDLKSLESTVNQYFKNLSGIDVTAVPEKYGDTVIQAKSVVQDNFKGCNTGCYVCDYVSRVPGTHRERI